VTKLGEMGLVRHVSRVTDIRNTYKIIVGKRAGSSLRIHRTDDRIILKITYQNYEYR
jgi:hypothetical protein